MLLATDVTYSFETTAVLDLKTYDVLLLSKNPSYDKRLAYQQRFGAVLYERQAPTFNFRVDVLGLLPLHQYTLIYFPDPMPGDNLLCLGSGFSNEQGKLLFAHNIEINTHMPADYDANFPNGARLRLVLSSDVDCKSRKFVDWRPSEYLFDTRLISYNDTDLLTGYSGQWCLVQKQVGGEAWVDLDIEQNGSDATAIADGYKYSGTVSGNRMTLSGIGPDDLNYVIDFVFSEDGKSFTGTISSVNETIIVSGKKGPCFSYEEPEGIPNCVLPVKVPSAVTGGQQFNSTYAGVMHTGIDFQFYYTLPTIVAPCDGVVTRISVRSDAHDNHVVEVGIRYNADWNNLIVFEPYSPDPFIVDQQRAQIAVPIGQVVRRGDILGQLVVPGDTAYPHVHWGVNKNRVGPVCPRDILISSQQLVLDTMYGSFKLSPPCLPPP